MKLDAEVADQRRLLADLQRITDDTAGWDDDQRRRLNAERIDRLESASKAVLQALVSAAEKLATAERLLGKR